jgi:hypothetical protein
MRTKKAVTKGARSLPPDDPVTTEFIGDKVDIRLRQAEDLLRTQSCKIEHDQCAAQDGTTQRRSMTTGETLARFKKAGGLRHE